MDNQNQQQQVFEGDFGDVDLEAEEDLNWLAEFDWQNQEMEVLPNQENVVLPAPEPPQFIMPLPNIQGEFEGGQFLLPQEQQEQPQEGQGFFYDDLGGVITEYVERSPEEYYPVLNYQQWAIAQDEEGIPIYSPRPY